MTNPEDIHFLSGTLKSKFPFPNPKFDQLSLCTTPIELIFEGTMFGHGTGFIWSAGEWQFLVTNWHNLSGQNPFSGSHLNNGARVPDEIYIYPTQISSDERGTKTATREQLRLKLYEDFHKPQWFQHNNFLSHRIDIAAIQICNKHEKQYASVNDVGFSSIYTHIGSDLFIVGYPFSQFDAMKMPIWKRGSLASEPFNAWEGRPAFLIDALSRPGMSGSPVFRRAFGPAPIYNNGELSVELGSVVSSMFVGIYSGHLLAKSDEITIGFAWYGSLIDQIIESPAPGSRLQPA